MYRTRKKFTPKDKTKVESCYILGAENCVGYSLTTSFRFNSVTFRQIVINDSYSIIVTADIRNVSLIRFLKNEACITDS